MFFSISLAVRDWLHERSLSLCAVLALASMLAPLLILQGVKNGLVNTMREQLMQDPEVLIITPVGGGPEGFYSETFLEKIRTIPGSSFVIGRPRDSATDMELGSVEGLSLSVQMEPCADGEPVLSHYALAAPQAGDNPQVVLSRSAADKLNLKIGDSVVVRLGRRTPEGRLESEKLPLTVSGILPPEATVRKMGFLPLSVLENVQDYRDYIAVPERGYTGIAQQSPERHYESFRMYARDLDSVEFLAQSLSDMNVETRTKAKEIASIRMLEDSISRVILIIALAVGAGFAAFTLSSVQGAVRRKDKMLGMLRLLGFSWADILVFPLTQTLLTGIFGCILAGLLYFSASIGIDKIFAGQVGTNLCRLGLTQYFIACALVLLLSALSAAHASAKAARIDPASVIRDI